VGIRIDERRSKEMSNGVDYQELIDEAEDQYEQGQDIQDAQLDQHEATVPQAKEQQSLYSWFWKVVRLGEPERLVKVGNLNNQEVGNFEVSVRDCMNLAELGRIFHHDTFASYWDKKAKITSATSMAKKGWFMDLSISQKKVRGRTKDESQGSDKWRLFKKKRENQYAD
jgi:CRISPR/Cas system-associated protein Cas5 (RAMP superfamily)